MTFNFIHVRNKGLLHIATTIDDVKRFTNGDYSVATELGWGSAAKMAMCGHLIFISNGKYWSLQKQNITYDQCPLDL